MPETKAQPSHSPTYNRAAVEQAIAADRRRTRISGKEAKLIHALLRGRT